MKALTTEEMTTLSAGDDWIGFGDGFCATWTLIAFASGGASVANPVGGTISGACAIYGIYRLASS